MATIKEKREEAAKIASHWAKKPIIDLNTSTGRGKNDSVNNLIDDWIVKYYSDNRNLDWCARFVSAVGGYVDQKLGGVKCIQTAGSNSFTKYGVIQEPLIGTAIMWKNDYSGSGTGHTGLVVEVSSDGSIKVAEGNTSADPKSTSRSGGNTRIKFEKYKKNSWKKLTIDAKANKYRICLGFGLLWPEDISSLQSPISEETKKQITEANATEYGSPNSSSGKMKDGQWVTGENSNSNSKTGNESSSEKKDYSAAEFGVDKDMLDKMKAGKIVPVDQATEFAPGPNAKQQTPVNGKKFNIDKQVLPVG